MKCLYFLALVVATQGLVLENSRVKREAELPRPSLLSFTAVDPHGFKLEWRPVISNDAKEPVIGYKVKIWELPEITTYKYKIVNGVKTLVEEHVPPKISSTEFPKGKPQEFVVDTTSVLYKDAKLGALYEARVLAFTKTQDGPISEPMRIKLHKDDHDKDVYKTV